MEMLHNIVLFVAIKPISDAFEKGQISFWIILIKPSDIFQKLIVVQLWTAVRAFRWHAVTITLLVCSFT